MKVVLISDTHLRHELHNIDIPEGDVLIHAGDALIGGDLSELIDFSKWFKALPHAHKVFVPGNHDRMFEEDANFASGFLPDSVTCLIDQAATIGGLNIYGSPWQPEFMGWAFNLPRGQALMERWDRIPSGLDVLVTHGPPKGILDNAGGSRRVGCEDLREAVVRTSPRLHVFGHVHGGYGISAEGETLYVNAAICDEAYDPVHAPIVVQIDDSGVKVVQGPKKVNPDRRIGRVPPSPIWE